MARQDKIIYLIPGLGADGRIFKRLDFPKEYRIKHVEWIKPHNKEPLPHYCERLKEQIDTNSEYVIMGLSFGGMVAVELSKLLNPFKTIIVSSIKTKHEKSPLHLLTAWTNPQRLIPSVLAIRFDFWYNTVLGPLTPEDKKWVQEIALSIDPFFTDWAAETGVHWNNETEISNLIHIHGDNDFLFPHQYIRNYIKIPGGTHYMIANRAEEISKIIKEQLSLSE